MVNPERIKYLFDQYVNHTSSDQEVQEFFVLVNNPKNKQCIEQLMDEFMTGHVFSRGLDQDQKNNILDEIFLHTESEIPVYDLPARKSSYFWKRGIAAACILISFSIAAYFSLYHPKKDQYTYYKGELQPGGNNATLTLADGKQLSLTNAANGTLAEQDAVQIKKTADGQLTYVVKSNYTNPNNEEIQYNTISTPNGGQYQVYLPDGTHVWLNSASSLRYPTSFTALKERKVELTGEAYFEVSKITEKSVRKPFLVKTYGQEVEVLGTHFNINSYSDEGATTTTLLEGSIKVKRAGVFEQIISPGEQARVNDQLKVSRIDTSMAVAWKNGVFKFANANINTVMNQFARWYDIDIEYEGKMPRNKFNGEMYRNMNASKAFQILGLAKINFRVEDPKEGHGRKKIVIVNTN